MDLQNLLLSNRKDAFKRLKIAYMISMLFLVGAFTKKNARLLQWVVFSAHSEWSTFVQLLSREVNPDFSWDVTFLHMTKSMCIAVQLRKFFSTIVNFIMSAF